MENEQQNGQQGYDRNQDMNKSQQPTAQQPNAQPIGGNDSGSGTGTTLSSGSSTGEMGAMETGQAAYGNSGETATTPGSEQGLADDQGSSGFIGSNSDEADMGSASQGMSQNSEYSRPDASLQQDGSSEQDFAAQGQGAVDSETMMGDEPSSRDQGTDDLDAEREQSRDSSSL